MKVENIEIILVCVIVAIQIWVFIRTVIQIGIFRRAIPQSSSFRISKIYIPLEKLEKLEPKEILSNLNEYKSKTVKANSNHVPAGDFNETDLLIEEDFDGNYLEEAEISIIETSARKNAVLSKILFSINNYLIRNKGSASDFNLVKDIVERNTDAVEEDINLTVAIPLYLGLMGTMIGIVIGLFNIPNLDAGLDAEGKDSVLNLGITLLIGGVKIAMIASFTGLFLTILNSGWIFKGSRSLIESRKNDFYTFIQIELLPIINQGLASTFESLQRNLSKFNNEFTINLRQLSGIFDSNTKGVKAQKELLDAIDKAKVSEMTRYNIKVLQQLEGTVEQFEKFNHYLININSFVDNSKNLTDKATELLSRTDNFKVIAENIESRLGQSQQLLDFLSKHFQNLDEQKEYISKHLETQKQFVADSIAEVGHSFSDIFKELKEHIQNSSEAVKQFTVDEIDALKKALSESKTNLSNLEYLESLNKDLSQFKNSSASQGERIKQQLEELNVNVTKSHSVFEEIERKIPKPKEKGKRLSLFKRLFKAKKAEDV
jgi:hypothetical protein